MTNVLGMNGCLKNRMMRKFLGDTMVRTLYFYCRGHRFSYLVRELRSHKPHGMAKKIVVRIQNGINLKFHN